MTHEERLARAEAQIEELMRSLAAFQKSQEETRSDIKKLLEAFNLGQGRAAGYAKTGGIILVVVTAGVTLWEHILVPLIRSISGGQ